MSKSDSAEMISRVDEVYQLIIQGWHSRAIVEYSREKWDVCAAQTRKYIASARQQIKEFAKQKQKTALGEMLARHDDIKSRAYKTGDLRLVLEVDREDSKLLGIYAPEKSEVKSDVSFVIRWDNANDNA